MTPKAELLDGKGISPDQINPNPVEKDAAALSLIILNRAVLGFEINTGEAAVLIGMIAENNGRERYVHPVLSSIEGRLFVLGGSVFGDIFRAREESLQGNGLVVDWGGEIGEVRYACGSFFDDNGDFIEGNRYDPFDFRFDGVTRSLVLFHVTRADQLEEGHLRKVRESVLGGLRSASEIHPSV